MLWGMTLVLELFSGYLMIQVLGLQVDALFCILMMMIGLVFLFLTNKERKKQMAYPNVFYKGYEQRVYYLSYLVILVITMAIIIKWYQHFSMTSPVLMLTWLVPMISYSLYHNVVICKEDTLQIAGKEIRYRDIKKTKIETTKRKERLYISGQNKNYYYEGSKEEVIKLKDIIQKKSKG